MAKAKGVTKPEREPISKEKKEIYKENKKKKLEEASKRENKNLQFLKEIMKSLGISIIRYAEAAGVSPQNINFMFKRDDVSLGRILDTIKKCGYIITPVLPSKEKKEEKTKNYALEFDSDIKLKEDIKIDRHKLLTDAIGPNSYISFLAEFTKDYLNENNISILEFCDKIGINYLVFRRILVNKDIRVSYLYLICEALDVPLTWKISKIGKN